MAVRMGFVVVAAAVATLVPALGGDAPETAPGVGSDRPAQIEQRALGLPQVRVEQQIVTVTPVQAVLREDGATHLQPAAAHRRRARRLPAEVSLLTRVRRAFIGNGAARPEPFPRPR